MNIYLVIITTVLVATQIIRLIQNSIQLRRQHILFKEQLGQIQDVTQEDLDIQRKAYRLIVEHFETAKIKPPIIRREERNIINVYAETEVDDMIVSHEPGILERKLQQELGKEVWKYATFEKSNIPQDYVVKGKAVISVLDKVAKDNEG